MAKTASSRSAIPRAVADRIRKRCETGEPFVVVPKNGNPSRLFGLEEFRRMQELPRKVKPWEHRRSKPSPPDPLGAVDARVLAPVRREDIYD
jgi:hypothetical protein